MDIHKLVSLTNLILFLLALVGYGVRIIVGYRAHDRKTFRIILPLFMLISFWGFIIYLFNITEWWRMIETDFEIYSRLYVRPFFTFLGSVLVLSSWAHPEAHPFIVKVEEALWNLVRGPISKK